MRLTRYKKKKKRKETKSTGDTKSRSNQSHTSGKLWRYPPHRTSSPKWNLTLANFPNPL